MSSDPREISKRIRSRIFRTAVVTALRPSRETRAWISEERRVSSVEGIFSKSESRPAEGIVGLSHVNGRHSTFDRSPRLILLGILACRGHVDRKLIEILRWSIDLAFG